MASYAIVQSCHDETTGSQESQREGIAAGGGVAVMSGLRLRRRNGQDRREERDRENRFVGHLSLLTIYQKTKWQCKRQSDCLRCATCYSGKCGCEQLYCLTFLTNCFIFSSA